MKIRNYKIINLITISIIILGGIYVSCKLITISDDNDPTDFLFALGQQIHFTYTDSNENENLIIKSDKKNYEGLGGNIVYFSIANTRRTKELINLQIHFDNNEGSVEKIEQWDAYNNKWVSLEDKLLVLKNNDELFTKKNTEYYTESKQTNYFKMTIAYPPFSKGEFWIEAKGDKDGYGLLDPWYSSDWRYRKKITIDAGKVTSNLTNFPLLATTTDIDLRDTDNGGKMASSTAGDLVFTDAIGNLLNYEIERYDNSTGELVSWIKTDLSSTTDTELYMYYGNSNNTTYYATTTGVWDDNYVGVWHLPNNNEASSTDSTKYDNDGVNLSIDSGDLVEANIDGGMTFDNDYSRVEITGDSELQLTSQGTLELWLKQSGADQDAYANYMVKSTNGTGATISYFLYHRDDNNIIRGGIYIDDSTSNSIEIAEFLQSDTDWHHLALAWDGSNITMYKDGQYASSTGQDGSCHQHSGEPLKIGGYCFGAASGSAGDFQGDMDEVRVSNAGRNAQWIETQYNNQSAVGEFMTFSSEEGSSLTKINTSLRNTLSDGLVGHWTFNGEDIDWGSNTAYDRSGQGNNGIATNMSTTTSPTDGISGQALEFDGSDDNVNCGNIQEAGEFTISFWMKPLVTYDASTADPITIMGKYNDTNNSMSIVISYWTQGIIDFKLEKNSSASRYELETTTSSWQANRWYHLVWVNGSSFAASRIYVDSVDETNLHSSQGGQPDMNFSANLRIGGGVNEQSQPSFTYVNAVIDEVRLYSTALSAAEAEQLYQSGARRFRPNASLKNTLTDGLVGHWTFNGEDIDWGSNTAYDRSGQGNNGIATNMSTTTSPTDGISGQALEFDGSDDYVNCGDIYNGVKTISFWTKANQSYNKKIIDIDGGTSQIELDGNSNLTATNFPAATIYIDGIIASAISTSTWQFVAITDSTGVNASDSDIGRVLTGYFDGILDEVRMYSTALSAAEVEQLYQSGARRFRPN